MASISGVDSPSCVVWRFRAVDRSSEFIKSSPFYLGNYRCEFQMKFETYRSGITKAFLTLKFATGYRGIPWPCRATTYIKSKNNNNSFNFPSRDVIISTAEKQIWAYDGMSEYFYSDWEIVVLFQPSMHTQRSESETVSFLTESEWRSNSIGTEGLSTDFSNLMEDKTSSDVTLRCGDRIFSAHRVVLEARSEVFAAMFRNKMVESDTGTVDISDMDPGILESFLKYVYSGKIEDLSENNVSSLYSTGDKYAVRTLQKESSTWILRHLTRENCLRFLLLADAHSDKGFVDGIIHFISDNAEVLKSAEWSQLVEHNPELANYVYRNDLRTMRYPSSASLFFNM